jgi:hypothetical protein
MTLLRRGALLRCGWCAAPRGILRGWFRHRDHCRRCGMSVERGQEGFSLGAATVNVTVTFLALIVAGAAATIVMYPDLAVVPLLVTLGIVAVVLPIVLYPFSYTIWFAIELAMEKPSEQEIAAADKRIGAGST